MLLISVGVSGLEGGGCPLCSISGRSHPGSAEVVTTFSAQDVVIRWPGGVQAPVGCLFPGHQPEFLNRLALGPAGRGGRAFRIPLPAVAAAAAWGRGELGVGEGRAEARGRGLGRIPGSPRTWAGPLFTTPGKPVTEQTKAGPTFPLPEVSGLLRIVLDVGPLHVC